MKWGQNDERSFPVTHHYSLAGGKRGDGGNGDEGRVGREMEGEVGEDEG